MEGGLVFPSARLEDPSAPPGIPMEVTRARFQAPTASQGSRLQWQVRALGPIWLHMGPVTVASARCEDPSASPVFLYCIDQCAFGHNTALHVFDFLVCLQVNAVYFINGLDCAKRVQRGSLRYVCESAIYLYEVRPFLDGDLCRCT